MFHTQSLVSNPSSKITLKMKQKQSNKKSGPLPQRGSFTWKYKGMVSEKKWS